MALMVDDHETLPVVVLRLLNGRVGSTLVMQLLATSPRVVFDRVYPFGEYRYLSYCMRMADVAARPHDPEADRVTPFFFASSDAGQIPWAPAVLDRDRLRPRLLEGLWQSMSGAMRAENPGAAWYAEKLVGSVDDIVAAGIPCVVLDVVRDPRDVLASIRSFTARGVDGLDQRPGDDQESYLERFITDAAVKLATIAAPCPCTRVVLRYEDFASDLDGVARTLGGLLGESFDAATVVAARGSYAHHVTTSSVEESIGRWRTDLTAADADRIWGRLESQLTQLGYPAT